MTEYHDIISSQPEQNQAVTLESRASRLGIDPSGKTERELMNSIVNFREHQSSCSQACEYVTGMLPDNPKLLDRLIEDQFIIRQKYGLPSVEIFKNDPTEYERRIRGSAEKAGIRVIPKSECGNYFEEFSDADAVTLKGERIGVNIRRNDELKLYKRDLVSLEHEYVHSQQRLKYPELPPELIEYEAYVINYDISKLKELPPEDRAFIIFGYLFLGSVRHIYQRRGQEIPWDNSQWFLTNIDRIGTAEESLTTQ